MLTPIYATPFKRDVRRAVRRGKDLKKIMGVVKLLCDRTPLPASLRDHALKGDYTGFRDCHVEPDLVLIYRIVEDRLELICARIGTHSDLFGS
jgi:mRNA interferase YafQ